MEDARSGVWRGLVLVLMGVLVFGEALSFGFLPFDDRALVVENGYVNEGVTISGLAWAAGLESSAEGLAREGVTNLWHPLTWLSHMLDVSVFGLERPWGHHLTGLRLHLLSGILVMLVAWRLLGSWNVALGVAALWLLHPMKVESAAWISERKGVLSGAFFWASLLAMVWSKREPSAIQSRLGLVFFVLAILGKPSVVILPLLVILLRGIRGGEGTERWSGRFWRQSLARYWLWFLISLGASVLTISLQLGGTHAEAAAESSLLERLFPQGYGMAFYLWRFLYPLGLSPDYAAPELPGWIFVASWVVLLAVLALLWVFRAKVPVLFFGVAWWCVALLPVSGLVYVGTSFTSDRYLYLASAGPLLAVGFLLTRGGAWQRPLATVAVLLVGLWGVLSFQQTRVWKDGWSLFSQVTRAQPKSALGWGNLGTMYLQSDQLVEAQSSLERAVARDPKDYIAWFNLGLAAQRLERPEEAIEAYQKSLQAKSSYLPSFKNLGIILMRQGRFAESLDVLRDGCEVSAYSEPELLLLASEAALRSGQRDEVRHYLSRLDALPNLAPVYEKGIETVRGLLEETP